MLGSQSPAPILTATLSSITAAYTSAASSITTCIETSSTGQADEAGDRRSHLQLRVSALQL